MVAYVGDFIKGQTVYHAWNTFDSNGASVNRSTNGTVQVYENGDATSETTAGVTDTETFDTLAGINAVQVDLSNAAYTAGNDYLVATKTETIDGQTVNAALFSFSVQNRADTKYLYHTDGILDASDADAATLTLAGTRSGSATNGRYDGLIGLVESGTGAGEQFLCGSAPDGVSYVGSTKVITYAVAPSTTLDATSNIIFLNTAYSSTITIPTNFGSLGISGAGVVTETATLTGHTAQTGDSFARLGAPAGSSVSADILTIDNELATLDTVADAIKAKTDSLTFTNANEVDSNVQSVNDTAAGGTGAVGDRWGPA